MNDFYHSAILRSGVKIPESYIYKKLIEHGYDCSVRKSGIKSVTISWCTDVTGSQKIVDYEYKWTYDLEEEFDKIINDVINVFSKAKASTESFLVMDEALE